MLGFVLGPIMEENFRRAMLFSGGSYSIFVSTWLSAGLLALAALLAVWTAWSSLRGRRLAALED